MQAHKFTTIADAKAFALAGNAIITLESLRTGAHFTYKIRAPKQDADGQPQDDIRFVGLLSGPDNGGDYAYLGIIGKDGQFRLTKASRAGMDAPSVKAFRYFWGLEIAALQNQIPAQLVVRHEGRCGRCGRPLTVPSSIDLGIGPECASKMGVEVDLDDVESDEPTHEHHDA